MQPNAIGMGLFADGGVLAAKPDAASANYIHNCVYDRKKRTGENACPFNFFYWDFLSRHREKLKSQGWMSFILKNCDRISPEEWQAIHQKAQDWHLSQEI
jgi:deoxyribodipyrimidine photolyase-related protein